ncbi:EthD family reductase [Streptomyces sp. NBC_01261]|uniref:EthD family reductase n=1 Tax=Streptomyces sp. NBC_01261 TaxID=2903802 RepID=UPI002E33B849|nr:EthD family reductase [Streptomyces sp. NBC_01261]
MTVKLMVLYTQPVDGDAFDEHYLGVHAPLVEAVPGLQRWESARVSGAADGGEQTFHRVAELYFTDMESLEAALGSDEGRATGRDYRQIAPPGSRMFIAALDE